MGTLLQALDAGTAVAQQGPGVRPVADSGEVGSARVARASHTLPDGYLGIAFTCRVRQSWGPDGIAIYHYGYPVVASVEPGSPAEAAGILAGDTILAYDSRSVLHRTIVLAKLLRPGTTLSVRVSRSGTIRDLDVRVARRPSSFVDMSDIGSAASPQYSAAPLPPSPPLASAPPSSPSPSPSSGAETPARATSPRATSDIDPETGGTTEIRFPDGPSVGAVAGAEVVRTDADLRQALGVGAGVLVIQVGDGTAAAAAGIRSGDVIVSVDGATVDAPITLARAVARAQTANATVSLRVIRQHRMRTLVMR